MGGEDSLNRAADMFADEPTEDADATEGFKDDERPSGVYKKAGRPPKRRGQAPSFPVPRGKSGGHRDDPTARTRPPPEWMERAWAGDTSLLPKKPPTSSGRP